MDVDEKLDEGDRTRRSGRAVAAALEEEDEDVDDAALFHAGEGRRSGRSTTGRAKKTTALKKRSRGGRGNESEEEDEEDEPGVELDEEDERALRALGLK